MGSRALNNKEIDELPKLKRQADELESGKLTLHSAQHMEIFGYALLKVKRF